MGSLASIASEVGQTATSPTGLFALLGIVVSVLYAMSLGRTRALVALFALHISYVLTVTFPYSHSFLSWVPTGWQDFTEVFLFLKGYIAVLVLLWMTMAKTRMTIAESSFWQIAIISVVQLGLLTSMMVSLVEPEVAHPLLSWMWYAVGSPIALWSWATASVGVMLLVKK
jgi:hypothetical protein